MDSTEKVSARPVALVTGASQGIGFAIAEELARRGYDLYLVSTPNGPLSESARVIGERYPVAVHTFRTNLSQMDNCQAVWEDVQRLGLRVSVLVNNAGMGSTGVFEDYPLGFYRDQVGLNAGSVVFMTHLFLPMLRSEPRAHVLNVGSLGGYFHIPNKEVYVATKAFVHSFTASLRIGLAGSGVRFSVLAPGAVNTNERLRAVNGMLKGLARQTVMVPADVARIAVDGMFAGREMIIPGFLNRFLLFLNLVTPSFIRNRILRANMRKHATVAHERLSGHSGTNEAPKSAAP